MGNDCGNCLQLGEGQEGQQKVNMIGTQDYNFLKNFTEGLLPVENFPDVGVPRLAKQAIFKHRKKQNHERTSQIWRLQFPKRCYYFGTIEKSKLASGFAVIYLLNNENAFEGYYQGEIVNCEAQDPSGLYVMPNGSTYKGSVRKNRAQGEGVFLNETEKITFTGIWQNNLPVGEGMLTTNEGSYKGSFEKGIKAGQGQYTWSDGSIYRGNFVNGKINGKGMLKSLNCTYNGTFENGIEHGNGEWEGFNQKYIGDFLNGKKHGKGKFFFESGAIYQGQFKDDKPNGKGKLINNGKIVEGIWIDGKNMCVF